MSENINLRQQVLLSIQRALWGMIFPEIRAIAVGFTENELTVIYYVDREVKESDYNNISEVTTEILADINFKKVTEKCIFTKEQLNQLDNLNSWVYIRKEK